MSKKQKFTPTPEQQKLSDKVVSLHKSVINTGGEPAGYDGFHDPYVRMWREAEEELLKTGYPREELSYVKQEMKQKRLDEAFNIIMTPIDLVVTPIATAAVFIACDLPDKIADYKQKFGQKIAAYKQRQGR